jgi:hypothetical protein
LIATLIGCVVTAMVAVTALVARLTTLTLLPSWLMA